MEHGTYSLPPAGWDMAGSDLPPPAPPWDPPEGKTTREWCLEPEPELVQVLGHLITERSRLVVGGDSGHGKTTVVMQMVRAVATGDEFLGMRGCGRPVMVLDLEQGRRTMRRRFREAGLATVDNVMAYSAPDGMNLLSPEQLAWITSTIEHGLASTPYAMVVLDPLYKLHEGDSNDERAMVDLMRALDNLRTRYGFALVIPMHLRKGNGLQKEPTMADIAGSGGLVRGAEMVVGIQRMPEDDRHHAKLHLWKDREGDLRDAAPGGVWNLWFDRAEGFRRAEDDQVVLLTSAQKVLRFLSEHPEPVSRPVIANGTGLAPRTVGDALARLMEAGEVERHQLRGPKGANLYVLPSSSIIIDGEDGVSVEAIGDAINGVGDG